MSEIERPINTTLDTLKDEIVTILDEKDAADSIVTKLSDVFKDLAIYIEITEENTQLKQKLKDQFYEASKLKKTERELTDAINILKIEKGTLLEQLSNWRENTTRVLSANVHILNGLSGDTTGANNDAVAGVDNVKL